MDGEIGVEQVCEPDALGLGGNSEGLAIAVETESSGSLHQLQPRLGLAEEQHLGRPVRASIDDVESIRADPLDTHDLNHRGAGNPSELRACNDFFEAKHASSLRAGHTRRRTTRTSRRQKANFCYLYRADEGHVGCAVLVPL